MKYIYLIILINLEIQIYQTKLIALCLKLTYYQIKVLTHIA